MPQDGLLLQGPCLDRPPPAAPEALHHLVSGWPLHQPPPLLQGKGGQGLSQDPLPTHPPPGASGYPPRVEWLCSRHGAVGPVCAFPGAPFSPQHAATLMADVPLEALSGCPSCPSVSPSLLPPGDHLPRACCVHWVPGALFHGRAQGAQACSPHPEHPWVFFRPSVYRTERPRLDTTLTATVPGRWGPPTAFSPPHLPGSHLWTLCPEEPEQLEAGPGVGGVGSVIQGKSQSAPQPTRG